MLIKLNVKVSKVYTSLQQYKLSTMSFASLSLRWREFMQYLG